VSGLYFWCFSRLSGAIRDDADGGAVQPHEVSHLSEPIILNANGAVNPLVRGRGPIDSIHLLEQLPQ
jgi:hypothetical protein